MKESAQRITFFHARISKEARAVLRLANLTGKDLDQYLLESIVFKHDHGKRFIRPELEAALTSYELNIKQEYESKLKEIQLIREIIKHNHDRPVSHHPKKREIDLEFCPFCKKELRNGKCSCEAWKIWKEKESEGDE